MNDAHIDCCRSAAWVGVTATLLATLAIPHIADLAVDLASFWPLGVLIAIPAIFIPYCARRGMRRLRSTLEVATLGLVAVLPVLILSYAAMRLALPLADKLLISADRAIGFDWPAFVRLVDGHAWIARALTYGYSSFLLQVLLLPLLLALANFEARAYQMVLGNILLCIVAISISTFFPALGAYEGHVLNGRELSHVDAAFGYAFLESFFAVRNNSEFTLSLGAAGGIVTFPSIHAAAALLCGWAAWPSRLLRLPFLTLNIIMAVSAVTNGGHYLVDVIAGIAVAAASIVGALRLTRGKVRASIRFPARPALALTPAAGHTSPPAKLGSDTAVQLGV